MAHAQVDGYMFTEVEGNDDMSKFGLTVLRAAEKSKLHRILRVCPTVLNFHRHEDRR